VKTAHQSWLVALAVVAYAACQAQDLVSAWRHAPYDRLGWLAFVIWMSPLGWARGLGKVPRAEPVGGLLAVGLAFSFLGAVASLNTLCYAGLACTLAGFCPWSWRNLFWLLAAASWMPALGYALHALTAGQVLATRLILATAGGAWMLWRLRMSPKDVK
jgi:hypothetical protein